METKTCSITEDEIKWLIAKHGALLTIEESEDHIERINYLNRRLKADKKEVKAEVQPYDAQTAAGAGVEVGVGVIKW